MDERALLEAGKHEERVAQPGDIRRPVLECDGGVAGAGAIEGESVAEQHQSKRLHERLHGRELAWNGARRVTKRNRTENTLAGSL